jgi:hypothetical protein
MMLRHKVDSNTNDMNVAISDQTTIAAGVETLKWLLVPSAAIEVIKMSSTASAMAIIRPKIFTQRYPLVMKELSQEKVKEKIAEEMKNLSGFSQIDTPPSSLGSKIQNGTTATAPTTEMTANQKSGFVYFRRASSNGYLGSIY